MLVYLATPYTHPDPATRRLRAEAAGKIACGLINKGHHVISPIAFFHFVAECGSLPTVFEYWLELNRKILSICGELWIVKMEGWVNSLGIAAEIRIAKEMNIPIRYVDPLTLEITE